jgi:hypothetical protein
MAFESIIGGAHAGEADFHVESSEETAAKDAVREARYGEDFETLLSSFEGREGAFVDFLRQLTVEQARKLDVRLNAAGYGIGRLKWVPAENSRAAGLCEEIILAQDRESERNVIGALSEFLE